MSFVNNNRCPLCRSERAEHYFEDKNRCYLQCRCCFLVFVPQRFFLSRKDEKKVYDLHENEVNDSGYRRFLSRLTHPLLERLQQEAGSPSHGLAGLDFGCGPGPALAAMLEEAGQRMECFDPFYHNQPSVLAGRYDFITATEVVEHLHNLDLEFQGLFSMLKVAGWLGIMTKLVKSKQAFGDWHYIRDLTHVRFYSRTTFIYLAGRFNAQVYFVADDVILLHKLS